MNNRLFSPQYLKAYYRLNGNTEDYTGLNSEGSWVGSASYTGNDYSRLCGEFDQTNYIRNDSLEMSFYSGNPFTIAFWGKFNPSAAVGVLSKWAPALRELEFRLNTSNSFLVNVGGNSTTTGFYDYSKTTFYVLTSDGINVKLFINSEDSGLSLVAGTVSNSVPIVFGGLGLNGGLEGCLYNILFYDVALTSTEIAELQNRTQVSPALVPVSYPLNKLNNGYFFEGLSGWSTIRGEADPISNNRIRMTRTAPFTYTEIRQFPVMEAGKTYLIETEFEKGTATSISILFLGGTIPVTVIAPDSGRYYLLYTANGSELRFEYRMNGALDSSGVVSFIRISEFKGEFYPPIPTEADLVLNSFVIDNKDLSFNNIDITVSSDVIMGKGAIFNSGSASWTSQTFTSYAYSYRETNGALSRYFYDGTNTYKNGVSGATLPLVVTATGFSGFSGELINLKLWDVAKDSFYIQQDYLQNRRTW